MPHKAVGHQDVTPRYTSGRDTLVIILYLFAVAEISVARGMRVLSVINLLAFS